MKSTIEILARIRQNSLEHPDEVFTRLYRYLLRDDIYFVAYKHLYSNNGAATKGINNDTADSFSESYIAKIIEKLKNGTYAPSPVRRVHIPKANGKTRPLGIPTFTDKLVQEVLRMILEAVYEPIFSDSSHGFRPNRGCHTALDTIKREWNGTTWFIEGDIKGCFDHINHQRLVDIIGEKIKDARFIQLIYKFLKAGYLEDWDYHKTHSGTPQGGIVSPILANIYLDKLDKFVEKLKADFDAPPERKFTPDYKRVKQQVERLSRKIRESPEEMRPELLAEWKAKRAEMQKIPAKSQSDKKLKYVRYADDFLISVNGSKEDCEKIKAELKEFINGTLKMELSEEKTLITHSSTAARFLGYDIRVRRNSEPRKGKRGTVRFHSYRVELLIPLKEKIEKFLFAHNAVCVKNGRLFPTKRDVLIDLTDLEILAMYNSEMRGICNYYSLAVNYGHLNYFSYLMEYSCLMTLAAKHRTTISKVRKKNVDCDGLWYIPYETKNGNKRMYFARSHKCKKSRQIQDKIGIAPLAYLHSRNSFEKRLKAKTCELCGASDCKVEVHHINKVRNLNGKALWEKIMIAKNRKTIVVCEKCHYQIHNKTMNNAD